MGMVLRISLIEPGFVDRPVARAEIKLPLSYSTELIEDQVVTLRDDWGTKIGNVTLRIGFFIVARHDLKTQLEKLGADKQMGAFSVAQVIEGSLLEGFQPIESGEAQPGILKGEPARLRDLNVICDR